MRRPLSALLALAVLVALVLFPLLRRARRDVPWEVQGTWPVMGTFLQARVSAADSLAAHDALRAARQAVFRVDSLMSTWKPASEISRLNAGAGAGSWQELSPETIAVLLAAQRYARASDGAFDISVGPLMDAWGFRSERRAPPTPEELVAARERVGYGALEVDSARGRARLARAGMAVDLGAIAKGYALDLAAGHARAAGAAAAMIDLGGNVLVFGRPGEGRGTWSVGIMDPVHPPGTLGRVELAEGSVATSGDYEQFFEHDGIRYSHIMDARTGAPARGVAQVTVSAPTGLQADALSTVLFVLGPERGRALLAGPLGRGATALWIPDRGADPAARVLAGADTTRFRLR